MGEIILIIVSLLLCKKIKNDKEIIKFERQLRIRFFGYFKTKPE